MGLTSVEASSGSSNSSNTSSMSNLQLAARPGYGTCGRDIILRANYFLILTQPHSRVHQYHVKVQPGCPPALNRKVIQEFAKCNRSAVGDRKLMYDGYNNVYCQKMLSIPDMTSNYKVELPNSATPFVVEIKWMKEIRLDAKLQEQMTKELTKGLDTVFRQFENNPYLPIGRSFFTPLSSYYGNLGQGKQLWQGFHQHVAPCEWGMMLNLDVSTGTFYKEQSVIELLHELSGKVNLHRPLQEPIRSKLEREVKGLRVEASHGKRRRYKVFGVSRRPARFESFPLQLADGRIVECGVEKYFRSKYEIQLQYPFLPCLQIDKNGSRKFLPMELSTIVQGQRCLKRLTDQDTPNPMRSNVLSSAARRRDINQQFKNLNFNQNPSLAEANLRVSTEMVGVPAHVLDPPMIMYGEQEMDQATPVEGAWEMKDKTFLVGKNVKNWALISFAPRHIVHNGAINNFTTTLSRTAAEMGMYIAPTPTTLAYMEPDLVTELFTWLKDRSPQFVMMVLYSKSGLYGRIKKQGDVIYGIPTQCVQLKNVLKITPQAISNLCLKINTKVGGTNSVLVPHCRPRLFNEPVIIFGAFLHHSGSGDPLKPSVAAVLASMDAHPLRYRASVKVQRRQHDAIQDLTVTVKDLLLKFYRETGYKPVKILFYRDGVVEEKLELTLAIELCAIRKACIELEENYKPGITYLTAQKRHHTRLFTPPTDSCQSRANIPAGTVVDRVISHCSHFDFYLCSHTSNQDTSRPTHYIVLWDDNNLGADVIHNLTYQLCHTYVRCNRSVSMPAPVQYAHLTAYRARAHLCELDFRANAEVVEDAILIRDMNNQIAVHETSFKSMYFI